MLQLKNHLVAFPARKLLVPVGAMAAPAAAKTTAPSSPLHEPTARAVFMTTVLATMLADHGFHHGGINE